MKIKIGVMGSAEEMPDVCEKAEALGRAIAARDAILLTGATTGLVTLPEKLRGMPAPHTSAFRRRTMLRNTLSDTRCRSTLVTRSFIPASD